MRIVNGRMASDDGACADVVADATITEARIRKRRMGVIIMPS
jgi:hypothetical protein